jgi:hypothetical protein
VRELVDRRKAWRTYIFRKVKDPSEEKAKDCRGKTNAYCASNCQPWPVQPAPQLLVQGQANVGACQRHKKKERRQKWKLGVCGGVGLA